MPSAAPGDDVVVVALDAGEDVGQLGGVEDRRERPHHRARRRRPARRRDRGRGPARRRATRCRARRVGPSPMSPISRPISWSAQARATAIRKPHGSIDACRRSAWPVGSGRTSTISLVAGREAQRDRADGVGHDGRPAQGGEAHRGEGGRGTGLHGFVRLP